MTTVLLPIKPKYVSLIMSGEKRYEFRKVKPKREGINKMIIYATSPIMKVVGEVEVLDILYDEKELVFSKTKDNPELDKDAFLRYFKNSKYACAYKLGNVTKYDHYKDLKDLNINYVPQSFIYLD